MEYKDSMKILKTVTGLILLFIVIIFIRSMIRGHRISEQHNIGQQINDGLSKECALMAFSVKQWALLRDSGMRENDVYIFLTNNKSENTKKYIAASLNWIYKDRSSSTPGAISGEVAAACVQGKVPDGLDVQ